MYECKAGTFWRRGTLGRLCVLLFVSVLLVMRGYFWACEGNFGHLPVLLAYADTFWCMQILLGARGYFWAHTGTLERVRVLLGTHGLFWAHSVTRVIKSVNPEFAPSEINTQCAKTDNVFSPYLTLPLPEVSNGAVALSSKSTPE